MIWFFDHILMWSAMIKSQNDLVSIRSPKLWRFYKINDSALKFVESTKWIEFLKCKKSQCWKSFFKTSNAKCIVCKCIKSKCSTTWCIIQLFIKIQWKISIIYWHNYDNKKVNMGHGGWHFLLEFLHSSLENNCTSLSHNVRYSSFKFKLMY